jgi:metallo-beta-lactamase family protein
MDADYLFIESTYGNRLHRPFEESKAELMEAIQYAVSHHQKVIIPAFALERTQEVLYILGEFSRSGQLPNIPVYLDSPLAIKATEIFRNNKKYYDEAASAILGQGFDPLDMPNLKLTPSAKESMEINRIQGSAIIIAGNGMCTAGRIKHHLKHNLWRPGASIVIVGFQAQGSTGRQIVDGAKMVTIFGEKVAVKAKVFTIGGLSSHADQAGLLDWVGHVAKKSKPRVFCIHGEPISCGALAALIRERFHLDVRVPQWGEVLSLEPSATGAALLPEIVPADLRQDALILAADMEATITRLRQHLTDKKEAFSADDVERLKDIRDELDSVIPG